MPKLEEVLGALIVAKLGQFAIHEDAAWKHSLEYQVKISCKF